MLVFPSLPLPFHLRKGVCVPKNIPGVNLSCPLVTSHLPYVFFPAFCYCS